jgi:hypothetical protein
MALSSFENNTAAGTWSSFGNCDMDVKPERVNDFGERRIQGKVMTHPKGILWNTDNSAALA